MFNDHRPLSSEVEYQALRAEVLKRVTLQHQITTLVFTVAGALLGLNILQLVEKPPLAPEDYLGHILTGLLLAYPIFAALLASEWIRQTLMLDHLGEYIRKNLEPPNNRWEKFWHDRLIHRERLTGLRLKTWVDLWFPSLIISQALLLVVGIVMMVLVHPKQAPDWWFYVLIGLDVIAIGLCFWFRAAVREERNRQDNRYHIQFTGEVGLIPKEVLEELGIALFEVTRHGVPSNQAAVRLGEHLMHLGYNPQFIHQAENCVLDIPPPILPLPAPLFPPAGVP